MTGWQAQAMLEADTARRWEELNAPDPCEKELIEAAGSLQVAINHLNKTLNWVADASAILSGTPMENVVLSYYEQIENLTSDLMSLREKYGKGER